MLIKVLHISSEKDWRGGERQIAYLLKETRNIGMESALACKEGSSLAFWCASNDIPYFEIQFKSAYDIKSALQIKKICKEESFDILHMHTSKAHTLGVISGVIGLQVPMVLSRRVDVPIKSNVGSYFKYNYSKIKRIICISEEIMQILLPKIKDTNKLSIIHSGIDIGRFKKIEPLDVHELHNIPRGHKLIGNTSALVEHKDYHTFLKTAKAIIDQRKDVHFLIMGEGKLKAKINSWIEKYELEGYVTLTGFVENVPQFLSKLDVFLFPSKTEGLGTSVLDAFAAQIPVVSTNAGGICEMVIHRTSGLIAQVGDFEQLSKHVQDVLEDNELRKHLIAGASRKLRSFSAKEMAEKHELLYQTILTNR